MNKALRMIIGLLSLTQLESYASIGGTIKEFFGGFSCTNQCLSGINAQNVESCKRHCTLDGYKGSDPEKIKKIEKMIYKYEQELKAIINNMEDALQKISLELEENKKKYKSKVEIKNSKNYITFSKPILFLTYNF